MVMKAARPRLSAEQKRALLTLGVTHSQVERLSHRLPSIARALEYPPPMTSVRKVLVEADEHAAALARIAAMGEAADQPAHRMALAILGASSTCVTSGSAASSDTGTLPLVPDFAAGARMLREMSTAALREATRSQRHGRSDPARAVHMLLAALKESQDAASRELVRRVRPVSEPSVRNPFGDIALIVFTAAAGDEFRDLRATVDAWKRWRRELDRKSAPSQ